MKQSLPLTAVILAVILAVGIVAPLQALEGKKDIYDGKLDVKKAVSDALLQAKKENKHLILMFGGNWCPWCHKLHELFNSDSGIKKFIADNYLLIMVDIGTRKEPLNADLVTMFRVQKLGYPSIAVLGQTGELLAVQSTGVLEKDKAHDPKRVMGFLTAQAPPEKK